MTRPPAEPSGWEQDYVAYVKARGPALRNFAYFLCGDWHRAEDHVQSAFLLLYGAWRRIDRSGSVDAYAHRILVRVVSGTRRRAWFGERVTADLPERIAPSDGTDDRLALMAALATLPAQQRATVTLRYLLDRPVVEVAEILGVAEGTVKSNAARGLAALREILRDPRWAWPEATLEDVR